MPPWTNKLLSSSSTSNINQQPSASANVDGHAYQSRPVLSNLDPPTLHPHAASQPVTRRHGRSISHPFPSIFGGGSRKEKKHSDKSGGGDFESTDDEAGKKPGRGSPQRNANAGSNPVSEKDLVLGRCMTCDSQVRWPRGLKTFRCTVCLAINDLEPFNDPPTSTPAKCEAESYSEVNIPRKGNISRPVDCLDI
jgi:E3 ubiquitin-protein ligase HECTD2